MIKTDIAAINTDLVPNMIEARPEAKNLKEVADQFEAIFSQSDPETGTPDKTGRNAVRQLSR